MAELQGVSAEYLSAINDYFATFLEEKGVQLANPIRRATIRSRQTIDVSAVTAPDAVVPMFSDTDAAAVAPYATTGSDVLTPEPNIRRGSNTPQDSVLAIFGVFFSLPQEPFCLLLIG